MYYHDIYLCFIALIILNTHPNEKDFFIFSVAFNIFLSVCINLDFKWKLTDESNLFLECFLASAGLSMSVLSSDSHYFGDR